MEKNKKEQILKKINKEHLVVPVLTEEEILKQHTVIKEFINKVSPCDKDGAVELRAIKKDLKEKEYIRSKPFWGGLTKEKDDEILFKHLKQLNGKGFCSYYSGFSFNYHQDIVKKIEKYVDNKTMETKEKIILETKGRIRNENAFCTQILPIDFDDITFEQYLEIKDIFINLDIETIDIWTGHGVQMIILLSEPVYQKDIFEHWTNLLVSKGLDVDIKIKDAARILRLPAGFNCKALLTRIDEEGKEVLVFPKYYKIIKNVFMIEDTDKRYSYFDIFKRVRTLQSVISDIEIDFLKDAELKARQITFEQNGNKKFEPKKAILDHNKTAIVPTEEVINALQSDYPMITIEELPHAVIHLLQGAPQGHRAQAMIFLAPFLQKYFKYDRKTIKMVAEIFENKCRPATRHFSWEDINRFLDHKTNYTTDLCNLFGYIDFKKIIVINADKMKISRQFFFHYNKLSDGAVYLYLKMKLFQEDTKKLSFTIIEIEELLGIKRRTFLKYVNELFKLELVGKSKVEKTKEQTFSYYLNLEKQNSYIPFNKSLLELLFIKCNNGEIKLYTYMKYLTIGEDKGTCTFAQSLLGIRTKKKQSTISKIMDRLVEKKFINKITIGQGVYISCIYKLLR